MDIGNCVHTVTGYAGPWDSGESDRGDVHVFAFADTRKLDVLLAALVHAQGSG